MKDGRKFAHTIDPVSGYPVQHNLLSATVISSEGAGVADAVATWCMVVGLESARQLVLEDPSLEAWPMTAPCRNGARRGSGFANKSHSRNHFQRPLQAVAEDVCGMNEEARTQADGLQRHCCHGADHKGGGEWKGQQIG